MLIIGYRLYNLRLDCAQSLPQTNEKESCLLARIFSYRIVTKTCRASEIMGIIISVWENLHLGEVL